MVVADGTAATTDTGPRAHPRTRVLAVVLGAAVLTGGCRDATGPTDLSCPTDRCLWSFSFEEGTQGWVPAAAEAGPWRVDRTTRRARDGRWSLELFADNRTDATKLWIERAVRVPPGAAYDVRVEYAVCCIAYGLDSPNLFQLIADARSGPLLGAPEPPVCYEPETHDDSSVTAVVGEAAMWRHKRFESTARDDGAGRLYVRIGVALMFEVPFTFQFDNIRLTLVRRPA